MDWLNRPENEIPTTRGCGVNLCWTKNPNSNCPWDYCVIRACATKFCIKNYT